MATWARRDFLRLSTVVIAAGVSGGCAAKVSGSPTAGSSPPSSDTEPTDGPTDDEPARDRVRVAVFRDSEPDSYEDESGEFTGQIPEIARAVFRLMGVGVSDVEFQPITEQAQGIAMLAVGEVDMIGGMAVRPEACLSVDFSPPDHVLFDALLVPAGNPLGLKTYAEIVATGASVAVLPGAERERVTRAGVPDGQIVELGYGELVPAITSGSVDCAVYLEVLLRALAAGSSGKAEVTPPFTAPGQQPVVVAFGHAKDSDLAEDFNAALVELQESGQWLRISEPFGYGEDSLPGSDVSIEKACAG